jgi:hemoglobin
MAKHQSPGAPGVALTEGSLMKTAKRLALACVVISLSTSCVLAEQPGSAAPTAEQQALNKTLLATLREVHDNGAKLYNDGDAAGCYRLLQGGLIAVRGMLDYRPDLQRKITDGLANADTNDSIRARAFALHGLIEDVRKQLRPGAKAEQPAPMPAATQPPAKEKMSADKPAAAEKQPSAGNPPSKPASEAKSPAENKPPAAEKPAIDPSAKTLWGRLGDTANVRNIVNDFVALAANDPKVDFTRGGKYQLSDVATVHLKRELIDFISQAAGGPFHYSGKSMKEAHEGMGITNAQFDASVADLKKALEKNGVQSADIDAVLKAVEATRKDIVESDASKP